MAHSDCLLITDYRSLVTGASTSGRTRTSNQRIKSPLLCQIELRRHTSGSGGGTRTRDLQVMSLASCLCSTPHRSGDGWTRTSDPGLMSPLLYQLSYVAKRNTRL